MSSLVYAGPGDDDSFLKMKYDRYILIDALPKHHHYKEGTSGYQIQKNFFECLKNKFGPYIEPTHQKNLLYFSKYNILYFHSTKLEDFELSEFVGNEEKKDLLLKGYHPNEEFVYNNNFDYIYLSSDTCEPDSNYSYEVVNLN